MVLIRNLFIGSETGAPLIRESTSTRCQPRGDWPEEAAQKPPAPQPVRSSSNSPAKKKTEMAVQQQKIPIDTNLPKNACARLRSNRQKCTVIVAKLYDFYEDGEEQYPHKKPLLSML